MITSLIISIVGVVGIISALIIIPNMKKCPQCGKRFSLEFERHTASGEVYKCKKCGNNTY